MLVHVLRLDPSNNSCYLEIDGRHVTIEDPFNEEEPILCWPRQSDNGIWTPFGAAPSGDQWLVFLYNNWDRNTLTQWFISAEGRFLGQQPISCVDLIDHAEHLHLVVERSFLPLMVQFPEVGRAASLRSLRLGLGDRQVARRFLHAYHRAHGRIELANRYARRLGDRQGRPLPAKIVQAATGSSPRVLYLIQAPGRLPEEMEAGFREVGAGFRCLTFRERIEHPSYLHGPGTTWTSGRNRLLEETRPLLGGYDYVVLMDDDVQFEGMGFGEALRRFHGFLSEARPEIGVAATPWHLGFGHLHDPQRPCSRVDGFDALFNAFRRDVVQDGILLPYFECFDHSSWWSSQLAMIQMTNRYYVVTQCNELIVSSTRSSEYPRFDIGAGAIQRVLQLCWGACSAISDLGPHGRDWQESADELQSSLRKRILRYYSFNPDLRDSIYRVPIEAF